MYPGQCAEHRTIQSSPLEISAWSVLTRGHLQITLGAARDRSGGNLGGQEIALHLLSIDNRGKRGNCSEVSTTLSSAYAGITAQVLLVVVLFGRRY